jgi:hypothetical protein
LYKTNLRHFSKLYFTAQVNLIFPILFVWKNFGDFQKLFNPFQNFIFFMILLLLFMLDVAAKRVIIKRNQKYFCKFFFLLLPLSEISLATNIFSLENAQTG